MYVYIYNVTCVSAVCGVVTCRRAGGDKFWKSKSVVSILIGWALISSFTFRKPYEPNINQRFAP